MRQRYVELEGQNGLVENSLDLRYFRAGDIKGTSVIELEGFKVADVGEVVERKLPRLQRERFPQQPLHDLAPAEIAEIANVGVADEFGTSAIRRRSNCFPVTLTSVKHWKLVSTERGNIGSQCTCAVDLRECNRPDAWIVAMSRESCFQLLVNRSKIAKEQRIAELGRLPPQDRADDT